jgi:hypothetical protein
VRLPIQSMPCMAAQHFAALHTSNAMQAPSAPMSKILAGESSGPVHLASTHACRNLPTASAAVPHKLCLVSLGMVHLMHGGSTVDTITL